MSGASRNAVLLLYSLIQIAAYLITARAGVYAVI